MSDTAKIKLDLLDKIKENYLFQNDDELVTLLEGLADPENTGVTYWDYIEVDTLLSLQKPKTKYPDEIIFIIYHQIHELYFKLIIQELTKITHPEKFDPDFMTDPENFKPKFIEVNEADRWNNALKRCTRYMNKLIESFDILKFGLSNQFREFRKALLPASGFQTHQFRVIELMLTTVNNLDIKDNMYKESINEGQGKCTYWRKGAIQQDTGKSTKLLSNFNNKYDELFQKQLIIYDSKNVYSRYLKGLDNFRALVKNSMQEFEKSILVWKIAHYIVISGHIGKNKPGTGGTDWPKYLSVYKQRIFYFPEFWDEKVREDEKVCKKELKKIVNQYPKIVKTEFIKIFKTSREQEQKTRVKMRV